MAIAVNAFGAGPSTKWGQANYPYSMTWGTAKWGAGLLSSDVTNIPPVDVVNMITDSVAPTDVVTTVFSIFTTVSVSVSPHSTESNEALQDGSLHWNYVFNGSTNFTSSTGQTWATNTGNSVVYTSGSTAVITWSSQ